MSFTIGLGLQSRPDFAVGGYVGRALFDVKITFKVRSAKASLQSIFL